MKHFLKISENIDMTPIMHGLALNPDLWNENSIRTKHPGTAHSDIEDIFLMFNDISGDVVDDIQVIPFRAWGILFPMRRLILDVMARVSGVQLGRCIITKLKPGGSIKPHVDEGAPATFYNRYQIVLQSLPGAIFHIGDESVTFQSGEVWLINNRETHSVVNNSYDDRIVCIVDIRSA